MNDSSARPPFSAYQCRDCGSQIGFRSRRRNLTERLFLPLLFMQPVRCGECFRRDYWFIFTPVLNRLSDRPASALAKRMPGKSADTSDRNVA
jgi:hypothetical protein